MGEGDGDGRGGIEDMEKLRRMKKMWKKITNEKMQNKKKGEIEDEEEKIKKKVPRNRKKKMRYKLKRVMRKEEKIKQKTKKRVVSSFFSLAIQKRERSYIVIIIVKI